MSRANPIQLTDVESIRRYAGEIEGFSKELGALTKQLMMDPDTQKASIIKHVDCIHSQSDALMKLIHKYR